MASIDRSTTMSSNSPVTCSTSTGASFRSVTGSADAATVSPVAVVSRALRGR